MESGQVKDVEEDVAQTFVDATAALAKAEGEERSILLQIDLAKKKRNRARDLLAAKLGDAPVMAFTVPNGRAVVVTAIHEGGRRAGTEVTIVTLRDFKATETFKNVTRYEVPHATSEE